MPSLTVCFDSQNTQTLQSKASQRDFSWPLHCASRKERISRAGSDLDFTCTNGQDPETIVGRDFWHRSLALLPEIEPTASSRTSCCARPGASLLWFFDREPDDETLRGVRPS
jgi:hypothetical protein